MQGLGSNLCNALLSRVIIYLKVWQEPRDRELEAYRAIAKRHVYTSIRLCVCEGCKMPYIKDDVFTGKLPGRVACSGACVTLVSCGANGCNADKCLKCGSCNMYLCERHANKAVRVGCCNKIVCKYCVAECKSCEKKLCHSHAFWDDDDDGMETPFCAGCEGFNPPKAKKVKPSSPL